MPEHTENENLSFDPNLERVRLPQPIPDPIPLPPEWWRCWRLGPVSGRYEGEMTEPHAGRQSLDLRVDIDPRHANSPVMDRVSGDFYRVFRFQWFGRVFRWQTYRESWIVDDPSVNWSNCQVEITGNVRFWSGGHGDTTVSIVIPWGSFRAAGPATATFTEAGGSSTYSCARKSSAFRHVTLEVDVCQTVNADPILPAYDTHAHPNRPAGLPRRTLTIEESYDEAGIALSINPTRTIIDDTALDDTNWLPSELHDAMESYFSQIGGSWPKWHLWALLASGVFEDPVHGIRTGVAGIMFDASVPGGAYEAPERQGCAVFREHWWFDDLVATPPANDDEAFALRQFLYTYVHEAGHAFNFKHSWDKGRPDALSWMNYPHRYDARNGDDTFWANFEFRFDNEELIHMRHGDRSSVIMGGDPWGSGGHLESPPGAMSTLEGGAPIELLLRSKGYFEFMEPVRVEFRLRNTSDIALELDTELSPEYGGVTVYIRRPDGRIVEYRPVLCKIAAHDTQTLKPKDDGVEGEDRHSQNVFLTYGSAGYYFDEPGEYQVRAVYQGAGDVLIPSNVHRVRIGRPYSADEERIAQDLFTYEAGMAQYLNGSSSTHVASGMETLELIADRFKNSNVGAQMALILARNQAQPFRPIKEEKRVVAREANPEKALDYTAAALAQQRKDNTALSNITYHHARRTRAELMADMGEKDEAKKELNSLVRYLKQHGVNEPVLEEIKAYAKSL